VLDAEVTPELVVEGLARDVVRQVQQARRDADLVVTDRINLRLSGDEAVLDAVRIHQDYVAGQVLATELSLGEVPADAVDTEVEGLALRISLSSI